MKKGLLIYLLLFVYSVGYSQQSSDYKLQTIIGQPVEDPVDIAADRFGNIYYINGAERDIIKVDSSGNYILTIPRGKGYFQSVVLDKEDNIYVSKYDFTYHVIQKISSTGQVLLQIGATNASDTTQQHYNNIPAFATDLEENIYLIDGDHQRIQKYDKYGKLVLQFSNEKFNGLRDIEVDAQGNIYVLDFINYQVNKFDATGNLVMEIYSPEKFDDASSSNSFYYLSHMILDEANNIYLSISGNYIRKFNPEGRFIEKIGSSGSLNGQFVGEITMAADAFGNLYTIDDALRCIQKFRTDGRFVVKWSHENNFSFFALDRTGNIYAVKSNPGANDKLIYKYNPAGRQIASFGVAGTAAGQLTTVFGIETDLQGNIYVLEINRVQKFSPEGIFLKAFSSFGPFTQNQDRYKFNDIALDAAGNIYIADGWEGIRKIGPDDRFLLKIELPTFENRSRQYATHVAIDGIGNVYALGIETFFMAKFDPQGKFLYEFPGEIADISADDQGNFYAFLNHGYANIQAYDVNGKPGKSVPATGYRMAVGNNFNFYATLSMYGAISLYSANTFKPLNLIKGRVFADTNLNCVKDTDESGIAGIVVAAEPGPYYTLTDKNGDYTIKVDTGTYQVKQILPAKEFGRTIRQVCEASKKPINFGNYGQAADGPEFGNQVSTAPYLVVSIGSDRRRRCFRNVTTLTYANAGFAPSQNATVHVQFPEYIKFITADAPFTKVKDNYYIFNVGHLQPSQQGSITIQDSVVCGDPAIRGLKVCTKAWITPTNKAVDSGGEAASQANVVIESQPAGDGEEQFTVKNTGDSATPDNLEMRVYVDGELAMSEPYTLPAGDSLVMRLPVEKKVVHVEVDQPADHPVKSMASKTVEPYNEQGQYNTPLSMAYPPDDAEAEIAEDCQPILDSFDPNDKQVIPAGLTSEKYTPTGSELRYKIRFQNTGNDVAYRVVLVDTLSEDLDISTLRQGSASHPYQLVVSGKAKPVLTFTFDNINLPDSARAPLESNGYIHFSIRPKVNLPAKTLIENYADIFFDFNEPVRTNTTLNRLYDMPVSLAAVQLNPQNVIISPAIDQITPQKGKAGTIITLTGRQFADTPLNNLVRFNGTLAEVLTATPATLTVRVPNGATSGKVQVATPIAGTSGNVDFEVYQPPTISQIIPAEGKPGTLITISGTNFSGEINQDTVFFGRVRAKIIQANATSLQVVVPAGAFTSEIVVNTPGGSIKSANVFQVWNLPVISNFSPAKGKVGSMVTITGDNFSANPKRNLLKLGQMGVEVSQATSTTLRVQIPASANTNAWYLETPGGSVHTATDFIFIPAPVMTDFSPPQGSVGTQVTITGFNFKADEQVDTIYFNGQKAAISSISSSSVTLKVPKGAQTGFITIAGAGGRATSVKEFIVQKLTPDQAVRVYPNPTKNEFNIDWSAAEFDLNKISIYNGLSQLVIEKEIFSSNVPERSLKMNLPDSKPGVYFLIFRTTSGLIKKRLVLL